MASENADAASDPLQNRPPRPWRLVVARSGLGLSVASEVDFDAFWKEALASALAAAGEDGATIFSLHPGAKSELLLACALGSLVCAFRHGRVEKRGGNYGFGGICQSLRCWFFKNGLFQRRRRGRAAGTSCIAFRYKDFPRGVKAALWCAVKTQSGLASSLALSLLSSAAAQAVISATTAILTFAQDISYAHGHPTAHTQLKLQYSVEHRDDAAREYGHVLAGQLTVRF